jgi:hypothetical protein
MVSDEATCASYQNAASLPNVISPDTF